MERLLVRYQEQWRYMLVGCGTTLINYAIYYALNFLGVYYVASNVAAWVGSVIFAYFANGAWVYGATSRRSWREGMEFALSRLLSLGMETFLLYLLVDLEHWDQNLTKLVLAVLVVALNYVTGRIVYHAGGNKTDS